MLQSVSEAFIPLEIGFLIGFSLLISQDLASQKSEIVVELRGKKITIEDWKK